MRTRNGRILVTSGSWHAALCCVEALGSRGFEVYIMDERRTPATHSKYCAGWVAGANEYASPDYARCLRNALQSRDYELLIPISDRAVAVVNHHRDTLSQHVQILLPKADQVGLGDDKAATTKLATELGIPTPRSFFPETLEEFEAACHSAGYPCVVKLPRGTGSKGVACARNYGEVRKFVETNGRPENWPFVQSYEPGDTADLAAVCNQGQVVGYHTFYAKPEHMIGGTPPYVYSINDDRMFDAAERLVRELHWHGAIDFDFTRTSDGRCLLLEINPRFSGTLSFARVVGIDLPKALIDVARGEVAESYGKRPPDMTPFRTGLPAEIDWWSRDVWRRTPELLRNWFDTSVLYVSRSSDPRLLFWQVIHVTGLVLRRWCLGRR